ncbi:helix-turn-helix domain-containing protein [Streptomyces sp. NPDC017405]|uniref:helix-turn-helix domain-containing protein n=1 Tax=unclassified Streptomyces TaxID=2593676 RepID=UPI0037B9B8A5
MRCAQDGGLTSERRAVREQLRREVAERFARGDDTAIVATDLRGTVRSVQRWRRSWAEGGPQAHRSVRPRSRC